MKAVNEYLGHVGLSEIETKLYLGLLETGSTTVMELANHVGIKRITAHFNIESLIAKGLVTETRKGARRQIVAEDPEKLKALLDERELEISQMKQTLPMIISNIMKTVPKPKTVDEVVIRYYEGKTAVRRVYDESLDAKEVRSFVNIDKYYEVFPETEDVFVSALDDVKDRVVWDLSIDSPLARKVAASHDRYHTKFIPSSDFFSGFDILIFNGKVAIIQLEKEHTTATVIESPLITNSFKALHETMWSLL